MSIFDKLRPDTQQAHAGSNYENTVLDSHRLAVDLTIPVALNSFARPST